MQEGIRFRTIFGFHRLTEEFRFSIIAPLSQPYDFNLNLIRRSVVCGMPHHASLLSWRLPPEDISTCHLPIPTPYSIEPWNSSEYKRSTGTFLANSATPAMK